MRQRVQIDAQEAARAVPMHACNTTHANDVFEAVRQLNSQILDALAHSARHASSFPLMSNIQDRLLALSFTQRQRASQCPSLLADVGFSNLERWRLLANEGEYERIDRQPEWLALGDAVVLCSAVLLIAWHIIQVRPGLAGILLGMPQTVVAVFRKLGLSELMKIARRYPHWVRPRWLERRDIWQSILSMGEHLSNDDVAVVSMRCLQACAAVSPALKGFEETESPPFRTLPMPGVRKDCDAPRFARRARQQDLVLAMRVHGARLGTIVQWTGLNRHRVRSLLRTYERDSGVDTGRRGTAPSQTAFFGRDPRIQSESLTLVLFVLEKNVISAAECDISNVLPDVERGFRLIKAYEAYMQIIPSPRIGLERAVLLIGELSRRNLVVQRCRTCSDPMIVDSLGVPQEFCPFCRNGGLAPN